MKNHSIFRVFSGFPIVLLVFTFGWMFTGCQGNSSTSPSHVGGTTPPTTVSSSGCTLTDNTSDSTTITSGCTLLNRNASGCVSSRTSQGLSGAWLQFSCRVTEAVTVISGVTYVQLTTNDLPDYESNYFPTSSPCYVAYTTSYPDPNTIASHGVTLNIPLNPNKTSQSMALGPVGLAIDGVAIYDNQAAPGNNIFDELGSFDECQGHPDNSSMYHYHTEPYSISHDDDNLIGVMRDGYFVYGRLDQNGTLPSNLDSNGGHTGVTPFSNGVSVYHYHLNLQSGVNTAGASVSGWFLTTGNYYGTPGSGSW